jgi:DNA replication protein DnaC
MEIQDRLNKIINSTRANSSHQNAQIQTCLIKYDCNICKSGNGWIVDIETNTAKKCKCLEGKIYKEILDKCGISEAFLKKTLDNYNINNKRQQEAKKVAKEYIEVFDSIRSTPYNSICFLGQVGSGKTHLSIAIVNELMKQNVGVRYMQYREAIMKLKQNVMDQEDYTREMNKYKSAPVLLIDDLYKGKKQGDADNNLVYEIVNYRYLKQLPMIISSEFTTDKLLSFDEAIGSRIIEMCKGRVIELTGEDLNFRLR